MLVDTLMVTFAYLITWVLISGRESLYPYRSLLFSSYVLFVLCFETVYVAMGMYDSLWRYAEASEFFKCALASLIALVIFVGMTLLIYTERRIPISVYLMSSLFAVSLTLYSRLTYRMMRDLGYKRSGEKPKRVMLVGAGEAGSSLLYELRKSSNKYSNVVCIVDDNPSKIGGTLMGVKIMGGMDDIPSLVDKCGIDEILIAIPSATDQEKRRILNICSSTSCPMRMLPDISKMLTEGKDLVDAVRDVRVEDLLGRDQVELDTQNFEKIKGRTILVTGAGGSIGSELSVQIASSHPKKLVLVDIYENSVYDVQQQLIRQYGDSLDLDVRIASVRDADKMNELFEEVKPDVVFHAAAHKHVPLMETSPEEAVKNNVFGTYNVAMAADRCGVGTFILISTDKAVNPTSIMGATKRLCEMVIEYVNSKSSTTFAAVRFGNVLGSNGSVIPLFKKQIEAGGPVTVTHPDVVRFFMTIPEAVNLVIRTAEIAKGGEVFVLDMGEPVRILDLAENLIRLAGYVPYKDIPIEFVGLRPGEKLYEELLINNTSLTQTENNKIFVDKLENLDPEFPKNLEELRKIAATNDSKAAVDKIISMVPTFMVEQYNEMTAERNGYDR
ncbi:MAG: polysaccharide biosynthesis protein [Oscillospiraceae bacterium]